MNVKTKDGERTIKLDAQERKHLRAAAAILKDLALYDGNLPAAAEVVSKAADRVNGEGIYSVHDPRPRSEP